MKYENKEAFEQVNMFGTGTPNTAYAKFFIGDSFLNPLTDPKGSLFAANVTFEPACRKMEYAARLLRRAGMSEQANEMADRVHKSSNYYEALGIISEYVETELSDHREQPRTPRKETLKKEDTCR